MQQLLQKADGWSDRIPHQTNHPVHVSINTPLSEVVPLFAKSDNLLATDDEGNVIRAVSQTDILMAVFQSFQYVDAYFTALVETLDLSVSVIDENANVVVWSEFAEKLFSIKAKDLLGKPITDFFTIEKLAMLKTLQTGNAVSHMHHQPREDLFVLINTNPIRIDGNIIGSVAVETDISSQVRLNQELYDATQKVHHLQKQMERLSPSFDPFQQIKGTSKAVSEVKKMITMLSATKTTVLLLGESGVGKELFARAIHNIREEKNAPFVEINCGAIAPSLFESELFGYEKGAFSGADQKGKKGMIELARGGTLFLDEIGEMPLDMQVKLLRVLQEKAYYPVGGTKKIEADFRVVAATNRDLEALIAEGKFREDLYYRLNVFSLLIPPLRERKEDIAELSQYFLHEFSIRYHRPVQGISSNLMHRLLEYHWPGNIRELRNTMERLVVFAQDGVVNEKYLTFSRHPKPIESPHAFLEDVQDIQSEQTFWEDRDRHERNMLLKALEMAKGNKQVAAKSLGISRKTLYNKMSKLNIPIR